MISRNICLVCGYDDLNEPPYYRQDNNPASGSHEICSCCGFQFGVDDLDKGYTHKTYREMWVESGARWYSNFTPPPLKWDYKEQLKNLK